MSEVFNLHRNRGWEFYAKGKFEEALAEWQDASCLNPDDSYVRNSIVQALAQLGRSEEALAAVRTAIQLDPEDAGLYNYLGYYLKVQAAKTKDKHGAEEAVAAFQQAIDIDDKNFYALHSLGALNWWLGKKREAVAALKAAVAIDPSNLKAYFQLGTYQARTGRFQEAFQTAYAIIRLPETEEKQQYLADCEHYTTQVLLVGAGLAAVLAGVWIWNRRRRDA